MGNSQFERDFNEQSALKRPGRLDFRTLNNTDDAGDGYPGVQKAIRNYFHEGYLEKDIDLNDKSLVDVSSIDGGGDAVVLNDDIDLNNNDLQNVKAIDGNGNAIILNDDINMNSKDLQNVKAIDVNAGAVTVGTVTPTNDQWGYIGEMDQDVSKNQSPIFVGLTLSADLVTTSTIDGVDVSTHDHSGAGGGGTVAFSSLSGDIIYEQLDSIVDTSGAGTADMISHAQHKHTDEDGSSKIAHVDTTGIGEDDHHPKTHNNNEHSTQYEVAFTKYLAFNKNWGSGSGTVTQGNDSRLTNKGTMNVPVTPGTGVTQTSDGIGLTDDGDSVYYGFHITSNFNTAQNITIYIVLSKGYSAQSNCTFDISIGAVKTNKTETFSWNILNGSPDSTGTVSVNGTFLLKSYTITAGQHDVGDYIKILIASTSAFDFTAYSATVNYVEAN